MSFPPFISKRFVFLQAAQEFTLDVHLLVFDAGAHRRNNFGNSDFIYG